MKRQTGTALALNWIAGYVDAVGFIVFFQVYLGNMTGNTVAIAEGVVQRRLDLLLTRGLAIPEFIAGLLVSRLLVEVLVLKGIIRVGAIVYGLEMLALLLLTILGSSASRTAAITPENSLLYVLIGLGAFAMGLQNATNTHFGPLDVRTTHVTGTISTFADHFAKYIVEKRAEERHKAVLYAAMWFLYLSGGIGGLVFLGVWYLRCLYIPVIGLAVITVADIVRPCGFSVGAVCDRPVLDSRKNGHS
jgi:uncharacterized membrane protein YoaK (UPF0700 family)